MDDMVASGGEEDSGSMEIKKELSDENERFDPSFVEEDDYITSKDGIFEVIPFMAKLLSNLKCSFYSKSGDIVVASVELLSVYELICRLQKNVIYPHRMIASSDSTFTLSISEDQFIKSSSPVGSSNNSIARFLPHMAIVTQCTDLALVIDNNEILIQSISYEKLASLMTRFKQYDMRPKQVDSMRDSLFSLVFDDTSFTNVDAMLKLFPTLNLPDLIALRRPRISPNYLRDYIVDQSDAATASPVASLVPLRPSLASSEGDSLVKRGRGRPRIRPKPIDVGIDLHGPKRPRGRPRRSDIVPNIIPRPNSFINIQPKGFSAQDIENCFVKFLESDLVSRRSPK